MTGSRFSDELLMSYVDGEVDKASAERIEAAMQGDEALVARIAIFMETRTLAKNSLASLLHEPVPASLASAVEEMIERHRSAPVTGTIIPLRPNGPSWTRRWSVPLAASIAAVIAGMSGFWLGTQNRAQPELLSFANIDKRALSNALSTMPSGTEIQIAGSADRLRVNASYRNRDGSICREFELKRVEASGLVSVSCRHNDAWQVTFAVMVGDNDREYEPASAPEALDAYLSSIEASSPLTGTEEKDALGKLK